MQQHINVPSYENNTVPGQPDPNRYDGGTNTINGGSATYYEPVTGDTKKNNKTIESNTEDRCYLVPVVREEDCDDEPEYQPPGNNLKKNGYNRKDKPHVYSVPEKTLLNPNDQRKRGELEDDSNYYSASNGRHKRGGLEGNTIYYSALPKS